MGKRKYVSPLLMQLTPGDDVIIVIGDSMDTGGTWGGECWDVVDQIWGEPAGKIVGCDGTHLGYLDTNEWILYDTDGTEVENFFDDYIGDVDIWLELEKGWECYDKCPDLAD